MSTLIPRTVPGERLKEYVAGQIKDPNSLMRKEFLLAANSYAILHNLRRYLAAQQVIEQQQMIDLLAAYEALKTGGKPVYGPLQEITPEMFANDPMVYDFHKEDKSDVDDDVSDDNRAIDDEYAALDAALNEDDDEYIESLGVDVNNADVHALMQHKTTATKLFGEDSANMQKYQEGLAKALDLMTTLSPTAKISLNYLLPTAVAALVTVGKGVEDITTNFVHALQHKADKINKAIDVVNDSLKQARPANNSPGR